MARGIKPCCGNSGFTTDFVGRRAELSQLEAVAGEAASDNSWVVLIEGSAGVGKTALLRRAMTGLWDSCVLHASCDPSEGDLPFGLVSQLLWRACCHAHPSLASAVRVAPDESPAHVGAQILEVVHAAQIDVRPGQKVAAWPPLSGCGRGRHHLIKQLQGARLIQDFKGRLGAQPRHPFG